MMVLVMMIIKKINKKWKSGDSFFYLWVYLGAIKGIYLGGIKGIYLGGIKGILSWWYKRYIILVL